MTSKSIVSVPAFLMLCAAVCIDHAAAQGSAREASPVGTISTAAIATGDEYTSSVEFYDGKVTVLQLERGRKAWDRVKASNAANEPPKPGWEYIVARLRFQFSARTRPGDKSYILREDQFTAFSEGGKEYDPAPIAYPKQNLNGKLYSGDAVEGWVAFLVAQNDKKPLMTFSRSLWFRLY